MAHQVDNIPWKLFASHFYLSLGTCDCRATNLHPCMKPGQGEELTYFVEVFVLTLAQHAECERRKYARKYDPPAPSEVILDEETVRKIGCSMRRVRDDRGIHREFSGGVCRWEAGKTCRCPTLPREGRTMAAFLGQYDWQHTSIDSNIQKFYNLEIVKSLISYGEMEPVLRIAAHPDVDLESWWRTAGSYSVDPEMGWDLLHQTALTAYIGLNVLYCFPETWDDASGRTAETDYRRTKLYQYMLWFCTRSGISEIPRYPHRQFFGISDRQFSSGPAMLRDMSQVHRWPGLIHPSGFIEWYPYGRLSFEEMLNLEKLAEYQPHESDIWKVRWMLCHKGLPVELALDIMELAEYEPRRRLKEPHDPFHPCNREELKQYLAYCWQVLVRCDMLAVALNMTIRWPDLVAECILDLLECI